MEQCGEASVLCSGIISVHTLCSLVNVNTWCMVYYCSESSCALLEMHWQDAIYLQVIHIMFNFVLLRHYVMHRFYLLVRLCAK